MFFILLFLHCAFVMLTRFLVHLGRSLRCNQLFPSRLSSSETHPHRAQFARAIFPRVWLKIESQTQCEADRAPSFSRIMSRSRSSWSDLPPFPVLPQRLSSLLHPSHGDEHPPDPRTAGRFGRLAIRVLRTTSPDAHTLTFFLCENRNASSADFFPVWAHQIVSRLKVK